MKNKSLDTLPEPLWKQGRSALWKGDCYPLMRAMPDDHVDAVVTDPPYCSGGMVRSDRAQSAASKYVVKGTALKRPDFSGDSRDQRSFLVWTSLWMGEAFRITRQGGYIMIFCDWRQLPVMSDALQVGGWVWRGILPWDKTEGTRPQLGWFRAQCEYVLLGSKGNMGQEQTRSVSICAAGIWRGIRQAEDRLHITGKPVGLMSHLLQVIPQGSLIIDPFAGAGATLVACAEGGYDFLGIEYTAEYCETIKARLDGILLK